MKKITVLFVCLAVLGIHMANAQKRTITGTVTSADDGTSLPGVSVAVKGTTIGTSTNIDGKYSLSGVPQDAQALVFSFVGMITKEVAIGASNTVSVSMESSSVDVDEVVVTAIGISRDEKTIGYAATNVSNENFEEQSQGDAMNALQGRVAGVSVTSGGGTPGSSTKVIIRGYSSVKGNNNPLYVIDGTPIDNSTRVGSSSGLDYGNRANDVNPNDIESMSILKGAAATALYGPRGANGVIMITTKKGKKGDKIKVEFSSSATVTDVLRLPKMQNTFGQGWSGHWADDENGSWGPKMDGVSRLWGNVYEGSQKVKPFSPVERNLYDFYDFGNSFSNSVSVSNGNENGNFYLSFGNVSSDGIIPTEVDKNNKNTVTFTGSTKANKLTVNTSVNYVNRKGNGVPDGNGGSNSAANLFSELLQIPRDFSIVDFKDYKGDPFNTLDYFYTPYAFNPYFALNENQSKFEENRTYGNISFTYDILDWMSATYRIGVDASSFNRKDHEAIMKFTPGSVNKVKKVTENPGLVLEETRNSRDLSQDILLNVKKSINDDWSLDGTLGFSTYETKYRRVTGKSNSLVIPEYYSLSNTDNPQTAETDEYQKRQYAYFGTGNAGFRNFAFLNLSYRMDFSSTLPKENNMISYPAANLSFLINEVVDIPIVDLLKVRASWGKAGNDADPYLLDAYMQSTEVWVPFSSTKFPIGGIGAFEKQDRIGNSTLKPELTTEYEVGLDFRAFNGRLGLDFAYYNKVTDGQILPITIPASSGFSSQIINLGEVQNKGVELLLTGTPVMKSNFSWDLAVNFTKNNNELLSLKDGVDEVILASAYDVEMVAKVGMPLGVLRVPDFKRDNQGRIIVSNKGIPVGTIEKTDMGDIHEDYNLGVTNSFKFFKDFGFSFNIDYRPGGLMYSGTADLNYFVGNATKTTFNERQPFIIPNSVKENPYYDEKDPNSQEYVENDIAITMNNINAYYYHSNKVAHRDRVISRDYLKLRTVTFSYKLPQKYLTGLFISEASIILAGNNLLLWTPKDNNFVDPESTSFGNDLRGAFGEFRAGPTVRSFTASLRVKF